MLKLDNVSKNLGGRYVVRELELELKRGERIALLGPNGAGKSTTMRMIVGIMAPTSGAILLEGEPLTPDRIEARRRIGYLPESVAPYPDMSVRSYLTFMAALRGVRKADRPKKVNAVVELTGLDGQQRRLIAHLSKGFRQRIGLAQALVHDPDLLVLDEPTLGLDPQQADETRAVISRIGLERTVLFSTHVLGEAAAVANRIVIIRNGQLIADGTLRSLAARFTKERRFRLEVQAPAEIVASHVGSLSATYRVRAKQDGAVAIVELVTDRDIRDDLADLVARMGWKLRELRTNEPALEQIYLEICRGEDAP